MKRLVYFENMILVWIAVLTFQTSGEDLTNEITLDILVEPLQPGKKIFTILKRYVNVFLYYFLANLCSVCNLLDSKFIDHGLFK